LLPDKPVVVNIGANVGTSTCAILEANPNAFIFSIDIKTHLAERDNVLACGLPAENVVRLLGDSNEIGAFWPYDVDMVFVDGAHHDTAVRKDIELFKPHCKSIMLFHDYHHPNYAKKPGVNLDAIVDEMMADWEVVGQARYLIAFRNLK
jgi:precorrin-6B methylase 2